MNNNFALIIGAMKSGTTSLFYYLTEHPEIAEIKNKEPHFFSYEANFAKGIEWYKDMWDWQSTNRIALEASTTYAMYPKYGNVAARIASIEDANFKFIYIIRHPFARVKSHIRHLISEGFQEEVAIGEEHLSYTEYAKQLDLYCELFGREKIHIMFLEDLQNNPQEQLCQICQFLSIDPNYEFTRINTVRNSKDTLNINPWIRNLYKNSSIKTVGRFVPPEIRQKFYSLLSRPEPLEIVLSEQDKEIICQRLQPDFEKLRQNYGIDVYQKWNLSTASMEY
ncbi:MAG: sulfotransferase family protein [Waterburya sp.]